MSADQIERAVRLGPERFSVDGEAVRASKAQQALLLRTRPIKSRDGGLVIPGAYANRKTVEALRGVGIIERFSWGLTPVGLAIFALLRWEKERHG